MQKELLESWKNNKDDREMRDALIQKEAHAKYKEMAAEKGIDEIKARGNKIKKPKSLELMFTPAASINRTNFKFKMAQSKKPLGLQGLKINNPNDVAAPPKVQIIERDSESSSEEESSDGMMEPGEDTLEQEEDEPANIMYRQSLTPIRKSNKQLDAEVGEALATSKA